MSVEKFCPRCKQTLPASSFYLRHKDNPNYLSTYCRNCQRPVGKAFRTRHRGKRFYADTLEEYLSQHVTPAEPDECWPWQGRLSPNGYGEACFKLARKGAHVFAYMAIHGAIPEGMCVLHTCDNKICCNPNHLWLGTLADNNRDRALKDRSYNGHVQLTHDQIRTIRELRANNVPYGRITRMLGLEYSTVYYAARTDTHPAVR